MEDRLNKVASHFSAILNAPPSNAILQPPPALPEAPAVQTGPITVKELTTACNATAAGKAPGDDGVPPDVVRIPELAKLLQTFMNNILCGSRPPKEFDTSIIIAIPKKGNSTALSNQRGIALMSSSAKLFNRILLQRLRVRMEDILLSLQAGFRPERGTAEQVLSLRICVENCLTRKKSLWILFLDFTKAFDSVDRRSLEQILLFYGVEQSFVNAIMSLYTNSLAYVRTSSGDTKSFRTRSGVLQGDTLAPYLFVIAMDYIMRMSLFQEDAYTVRRRLSSRKPEVKLSALAYADDAALLANSHDAAQRQLHRFEKISQEVGLHLSEMKSEVMVVDNNENNNDVNSLSGEILRKCEDFNYLGSQMRNSSASFRSRRQKAWTSARNLRDIWDSSASVPTKVKLFQAMVESVLLYCGETWTLTESLGSEINASHRALLRYCIGIHYPATITSAELYNTTKSLPASTILRRKRLALLGHATRRPDTPLALVINKNNHPSEQLRPGRRRKTYCDQIEEDLQSIGLQFTDVDRIAANRKRWKNLVSQL